MTYRWPQAECTHEHMPPPERIMGFNPETGAVQCVAEVMNTCPDCGYDPEGD